MTGCGVEFRVLGPLKVIRGGTELLAQAAHQPQVVSTWDSLGFIHHNLRAYAEAVTCYEHGAARYREIGNRLGDAETLDRLGDSQLAGGDSVRARAAWQDAIRILVDLDHPDATERITAKLAS